MVNPIWCIIPYFDVKKVDDIQAKRGGCKNCPPTVDKSESFIMQKNNVSKRNENRYK